MLSSRPLNTVAGSASLARQRLLADQTLRRAALDGRTASCDAPPEDQRQLLQQIANSFPDHFISRLTQLNNQLTVAVITPRPSANRSATVPYRITIDPSGNVSVSTLEDSVIAPHPGAFLPIQNRERILRALALLITTVIASFVAFGFI